MASYEDTRQKVSKSMLESLLEIHGEADNLDFKQVYSLKTPKAKAELVRDIIVFANTEGGGHIIFGVEDKTFTPIGLSETVHLDTTEMYRLLQKYTEAINFMVAEYELERTDWPETRRFGILYIAEAAMPILPRIQVAYQEEGNRSPTILLNEGDIFVRRGAQSIKADQQSMYRLLKRKSQFNEPDKKGSLRRQWRRLETLYYPLLSNTDSSRSHFINDLAYSLHQTFASKGYTQLTSLLRVTSRNVQGREYPIYELLCHEVEFCEAVRQRGAGFISKVLSMKESNLDIESKNRLKDMMYQAITMEHAAFFSKWRLSAKVGFSTDWMPMKCIYDPSTSTITLQSIEKVSVNPSDYPERVHTTSDLLRYIASLSIMAIANMGLLEWYADNYPLTKLIIEVMDKGTFDLDRIRINVKDYEEWDYDSGYVDEETGRFKAEY